MTDYRPAAGGAASRHDVPRPMFERLIQQESGFNPDARSPAGAVGIAQLIPRFHPDVDATDPLASLDYAAGWLSRLYRQYGSWRKSLIAYNWGPGNLQNWNGQPSSLPAETRHYLDVILGPGWTEPATSDVPSGTNDVPSGQTMSDHLTVTDDANFRPAPSLSTKPIQTLKRGSPVWSTGGAEVQAEGHVWVPVALGPTGWIAKELLTSGSVSSSSNEEPKEEPSPFFNPDYPVSTQQHDWDCAQDSTWWALRALGRKPDNAWMEQMMLAGGVESTDVGLTDATGQKLAAWINGQYEPEIHAYAIPEVSFAQASHLAGTTAVLLGGHNWHNGTGHWVALRRHRDGVLELANPGGQFSKNYGQQTLDRAAWDAKAPWSAVVLERKA